MNGIGYLLVGGPRHGETQGLNGEPREFRIAIMPRMWPDVWYTGRDAPTIRSGVYERRAIADRVCYVWRGEE